MSNDCAVITGANRLCLRPTLYNDCAVITGANPTVFEVDGEQLTPLDYAVIGQHQEVATLLIEHGALSISLVRDLAAICIQKVGTYYTQL